MSIADDEFENPVLRKLREERAALDAPGSRLPPERPDFAAHRIATRKAFDELRKELGDDSPGVRRILAGDFVPVDPMQRLRELDARLRRIEQHLGLPPLDAH